MNVARPILKTEYEAFRAEMYTIKDGAEVSCRFTVGLDADPTMRPKNMTEKMAETQSRKDRMLVILNRAVLNEAYWKTVIKRVDARLESEIARAYLDPSMKELKNQELRSGNATVIAEKAVLANLFGDKGTYDEQMTTIYRNAQDGIAFLAECKNIFDNLSDTSIALSVQLKSVMVNAKVYGDPAGEVEPLIRNNGR
jgi:hypothetical protein